MAPKMKFSEGEKVLCFHGPLIYEAKCLKSSITKDKHVKYFIHYAGWNKNWDEWVPESRVLKYNEANVQKQKEVQEAHSAQPTKSRKVSKGRKSEIAVEESRSSTPAAKDSEQTATSTKARNKDKDKDSHADSGSDQPKKKRGRLDTSLGSDLHSSIKIILPDELKQLLIDDWYLITKQQKLQTLPAKVTINQIFENYYQQKNITSLETKTVFEGVKDHFIAILNKQLLYTFEKLHLTNFLAENPGLLLCDIYGVVHLLRLFTKLGSMLAYVDMQDKALQFTLNSIHEFLDYLVKNKSSLWSVEEYIASSPEYQKKAVL